MPNYYSTLGDVLKKVADIPGNLIGVLYDLLEKLTASHNGEWWDELKKFLRKEPCWTGNHETHTPPPLLELVSTLIVEATAKKFVAKEKFVCDVDHKAKVKISYLGDNFKAWFLNGDGKTEDPITEQRLHCHKLRRREEDSLIIAELGGEDKAFTTLSEMFSLMEKQKHGEDGALFNMGSTNIFYIKDVTGVLRTVYVGWSEDGWSILASSAEYQCLWHEGYRVFARAA